MLLKLRERQFLLVNRTGVASSLVLARPQAYRTPSRNRLSRFGASLAAVSFLGSSSGEVAPVILPASIQTGAISEVLVGVQSVSLYHLQEQTPLS